MKNKNRNVKNIIKTKINTLLVLIAIQIVIFIIILNSFNKFDELTNIKTPISVCIIIFLLIIDTLFYKFFISKAKFYLNVEPIECTIENFLVVSSKSYGDSTNYWIYPIARANNKLFFTYGNYCIKNYNHTISISNNTLAKMELLRNDGSMVQIRDKAYLYIKDNINVDVDIDIAKDRFRLNDGIKHFNIINRNCDINTIKNLNFFEGFIDVEPTE